MARNEAGLKKVLEKIPALREEFWKNLNVLGDGQELNQALGLEAELAGQLTPRELEIARLVALRLDNQEIANRLFISVKTVQTHRAHIMEKLDLSNPADLIKYALKSGVISLDGGS